MVGIALFLFGVGALDCKADDSAVSRATLAGLQGVRVIVEEPQPNIQRYAEKYGLTRAQVQADVERRLQQAGIRTVQGDEWLKTPGRPLLYVNINTHETEKYWYAYDIRLELRQLVLLEAPASSGLSSEAISKPMFPFLLFFANEFVVTRILSALHLLPFS